MSKESTERGLGLRFHGTPTREKAKREKAKREEQTRRGAFVPEARDNARLLPRLVGAPRR